MRVLAIDPGIATGKPTAMVYMETDNPQVLSYYLSPVPGSRLFNKYVHWLHALKAFVTVCMHLTVASIDLVAVEDARGVGGRGSARLLVLVDLLVDLCAELGLECVLVNNQEAKSAVVASGKRNNENVAQNVNTYVVGATSLPEESDFDYHACVSIGLAGEAKWRIRQMTGNE